VHRRVVCQLFPHLSAPLKNGLTSVFCWPLIAVPAVVAVVFAENPLTLAAALVGFAIAYAAVYSRLSQFRWCFSPATLQPTLLQNQTSPH